MSVPEQPTEDVQSVTCSTTPSSLYFLSVPEVRRRLTAARLRSIEKVIDLV